MNVFMFGCFAILALVPGCFACYFPDYLQGEFLMQSPNSLPGQVRYTEVNITAEAVSLWGFCNKKITTGLYLIDSFNGTYCMRCFHISSKSPNIVIIHLAGHTDRCFMSSQAAESSCPKLDQLESSRQIILFKIKPEIRKEYCPFNGRYGIRFKQNKPDYPIECNSQSSVLDNCPVGSEMNIRFRDCHFENHDLVFECLGSWNGPQNQKYLALFDTRTENDPRPQYRCGLYREEPGSGTVYMAFSSDSTCITDLLSSQSGFETLVLNKQILNVPAQINGRSCRFPDWLEGRWELVTVDGNTFTYLDQTYFRNYTFECVEDVEQKYNYPTSADDRRFLVYGKSHCNEEIYTCIWIKRRGDNVFEFQLANKPSQYFNASLCSPLNFQTNMWITQGMSPCPILGEYIGMLPNLENLCAKLSSDCVTQDTMYYMVSDCSQQQIYEGSSSGVKYRKIRQTNDSHLPEKIPANESFSRPIDAKNETNSQLNITTPIPLDSTPVVNVINHTTSQPTISTTQSTTTDLRPEPSERVIYDNYQTSTEISVGSYYIENRNLGDFSRDIRLLPAPISSSTASPYPYRRNYVPSNYPYNDYPRYNPSYRDNYDRQYRTGFYQPEYRNTGWNQSNLQTHSNQMFVMDPMSYRPPERKTVIALPPVQLPPVSARPTSSRRHINVNMFKEREYRCLGQWQENNLTYTFTQRKDIGTYECFVGRIISDYEIAVREAGKYCERNVNLLMLEMNLSQKSSCAENRTSTMIAFNTPVTTTPTVTTTKYSVNKRILQHTTKPWRPSTNISRPQSPYRTKNNSNSSPMIKVSTHLFILPSLHVVICKFLYFTFTSS